MEEEKKFDIAEELKKLPGKPGVYIMHNAQDEILYVGKAVSLKNRVRQYFQNSKKHSPKIERMVEKIDNFEYIVTDSELEALVLESNLIKEHKPPYNTMLTDDKTYPYIRLTLEEDFPRIIVARHQKKDHSRYFGPYPNATAVRDTIELLRKLYHLRSCSKKLSRDVKTDRPCLYYHIGQCLAPCTGNVSKEAYAENVQKALHFLEGHSKEEVKKIREKMEAAAAEMRYEEAASYRDLIESIEAIGQQQIITRGDGDDRDIVALAMDEEASAVVQVFFIRGGKLLGREHFYLEVQSDDAEPDVLRSFISQYYGGTAFIPSEIMLGMDVRDRALLEEWLSDKRGRSVHIRIPQRGAKEKLVAMAQENAETILSRDKERLRREVLRTSGAAREIASLLSLDSADRMEAYDISNTSGADSVGSMVVYEKGRPKRSDYRKFRIKWVQGPNDYASMEEVLTRRFRRAIDGSKGFAELPDLILMDGGRGQVHSAEKVLAQLGLAIPVAGMVKDDYHRTRALFYGNREVPLAHDSEAFHLLTRIQDEVHRFAIEYHKLLRSKGQVHSVLDDIPGIGPARRKALLRSFKTVEGIRDASLDELTHAPSMNERAALAVYETFHKKEDTDAD